ncbi:MAG: replicative DNA helicase [Nitrosopumilus sp.]
MEMHDIEAEQAVLGSIFFENSIIDEVIEKLKPENFYKIEHNKIFAAMLEINDEGKPIDEILIGDKLRSKNQLEEAGGFSYIGGLVDCSPEIGNVSEYISIVYNKSISRELSQLGNDAKNLASTMGTNEAISEVFARITKLSDSIQNRVEFRSISDILGSVFDTLQSVSETPGKIVGFKTGYRDIDSLTLGIHPKELFILAARPGMGKTALAMNISTRVASEYKEFDVLIFSIEMHSEQLGTRVISAESKVDSIKIRNGNLNQSQWDNLAENRNRLVEMPIYVNDSVSTIEKLVYLAKKHRKKNKISLIVVDYLQILKTIKNKFSREQEISEISRSLKLLAKDLDCSVIALSQLNRDVEKRQDKRPLLSDLRDSGAIEQDADIIAFIYRDEYYNKNSDKKGIAEIDFAKHRNGKTGTVELLFRAEYTRFDNLYKH